MHFFHTSDYSKYYCVTKEEMEMIPTEYRDFELNTKDELEKMCSNTDGNSIKFSKTGNTYYYLDSLKEDWLTIKLARIQ